MKTEAPSPIEQRTNFLAKATSNLIPAAVVLTGFFVRVWVGWGTFLNPDEALHVRLANQPSLWLAYQQSLTASHPPLLTILHYYFRLLGTSELWLRMPSITAGAVFCWAFYKWLERATNRLTALIGLIFVSFLPPIVSLSAEIRQYALMLAFLAGALYFNDCAVEKNSIGAMAASVACLYLALSSHYSAFFFAAALGVYTVLLFSAARTERNETRRRLIAVWTAGQTGVLMLAAFYYRTHISHLGAGISRPVLQGWMSDFFLRRSYYEAGRDNPLLFVPGHAFGVFQFFFGQLAMGDLVGLLFFVGAVLLLRGRGPATNIFASRALGVFLLLLFGLACCLSLFHLYPFGGTRHDAFLIVPGIAGVSVAVATCARDKWGRGIGIAFVLLLLCVIFGKPRPPRMERADQSTRKMQAAIEFVMQNVPHDAPIFTDYQSDLILGHYLCSQHPIVLEAAPEGFEQFHCGGYQVISADYKSAWMFSGENFLTQWQRLVQTYSFKPGRQVWIFQTGWGIGLPEDLRRGFPQFRGLVYESFGANIKIFELTVGDEAHVASVRIGNAAAQRFEGKLSPSAFKVSSSGAARPSFFVTSPKLPE